VPTNNLGLIDPLDSPARPQAAERYAFVGDSFTAGQGARPWIPALRDALWRAGHDVDVFNLGIEGTGVQHFAKLLESLGPELRFNHVVVLLISADLTRPQWRPVLHGEELRFCPSGVSERLC